MTTQHLREHLDRQHARIMAEFDDLDTVIQRIRAGMVADGLIRAPSNRTRSGDKPEEA